MEHFNATINTPRGQVSRDGYAETGIWAGVRGGGIGVEVNAITDSAGTDRIDIFANGGSNSDGRLQSIGTIVRVDGVVTFLPEA